jgi:hypothetical protein
MSQSLKENYEHNKSIAVLRSEGTQVKMDGGFKN